MYVLRPQHSAHTLRSAKFGFLWQQEFPKQVAVHGSLHVITPLLVISFVSPAVAVTLPLVLQTMHLSATLRVGQARFKVKSLDQSLVYSLSASFPTVVSVSPFKIP